MPGKLPTPNDKCPYRVRRQGKKPCENVGREWIDAATLPRNAWSCQKLEEAREDFSPGDFGESTACHYVDFGLLIHRTVRE